MHRFGLRRKFNFNIVLYVVTSIRLHGHITESVDYSKYLEVSISENLTWKKHVGNTAAKSIRVPTRQP